MPEEPPETDKLKNDEENIPSIKYKDPCIFLCSTRWRICLCILLSFTLLYMHRVNLSLAVVCMVDTTGTQSEAELYSNNERENNTSFEHVTNNTQYSSLHEQKNLTLPISVLSNDVTHDVKNGGMTSVEATYVCGGILANDNQEWIPELKWTKSEISFLLSSYFYGSFFTQIPAGAMADTFGGKHIISAAMIVSTICSLLTPICARTSIILMFAVRIATGLAGGSVIPAGMSMINAWSTPDERPLMIAVSATGLLSGTVVTYLTSGLLCAYGFDNGWPSIFYIHGCLSTLFVLLWFFEGYSKPEHHPRISEKELRHIHTSKGQIAKVRRPKTPWKPLLLSKPLWAVIIAHFCFNWGFFTLLINVPLFLKEVLHYDIKSNGLFSALPFVFQIISSLICGKVSAVLVKRRIIGHLAVRRLFNSISLIGIGACLVGAGYVSCEVRYIAIILLCLACAFAGFGYGGFFANHPEFAGQFAGTAFGITNAGGVISSLIASMLAGLLTPNGQPEEWRLVLYLAAGVNIIGATAFILCSDVNLQPWARNQEVITIEVDAQETKTSDKIKKHSSKTIDFEEIKPLQSENNGEVEIELEDGIQLQNKESSIRELDEKKETQSLNKSVS